MNTQTDKETGRSTDAAKLLYRGIEYIRNGNIGPFHKTGVSRMSEYNFTSKTRFFRDGEKVKAIYAGSHFKTLRSLKADVDLFYSGNPNVTEGRE